LDAVVQSFYRTVPSGRTVGAKQRARNSCRAIAAGTVRHRAEPQVIVPGRICDVHLVHLYPDPGIADIWTGARIGARIGCFFVVIGEAPVHATNDFIDHLFMGGVPELEVDGAIARVMEEDKIHPQQAQVAERIRKISIKRV
jgi:hypothetical protein